MPPRGTRCLLLDCDPSPEIKRTSPKGEATNAASQTGPLQALPLLGVAGLQLALRLRNNRLSAQRRVARLSGSS